MTEEWRPVRGFPGYEVSSLGRVRSLPRVVIRSNGAPFTVRGGVKSQQPLSNGHYPKVDLRLDGKQRSVPVHRLVGEAFLGPLPTGLETRHLNGDGFDNRVENLCYGTHAENMQDSIEHGTHVSLVMKARTHCSNGHEYTPQNTWRDAHGSRLCRRCSINRTLASGRRKQDEREASGAVTPRVIRRWAAPIFGVEASRTGRMHDDIKWAYAYAHPDKGWTPTPDPRRSSFVPPSPSELIQRRPDLAPLLRTRELKAA